MNLTDEKLRKMIVEEIVKSKLSCNKDKQNVTESYDRDNPLDRLAYAVQDRTVSVKSVDGDVITIYTGDKHAIRVKVLGWENQRSK
jgi:hypothetical protein